MYFINTELAQDRERTEERDGRGGSIMKLFQLHMCRNTCIEHWCLSTPIETMDGLFAFFCVALMRCSLLQMSSLFSIHPGLLQQSLCRH